MTRKFFLVLSALILSAGVHAQLPAGDSVVKLSSRDLVFTYVEEMPAFPGGQNELMKFLRDNIQYPPDARAAGAEGKVIAQFIVNEVGKISDIIILRGIYPSCDSEVVRVISKMPQWKPGKQNNNQVKVYFKLPVTFKLNEADLTRANITLPAYPTGEDSLNAFIRSNLQYPKQAKKDKVQGMVTLSFNVDSAGNARDIKVYKSLGKDCDEEAIRLLKLIPHWIPGTKEGKLVTMPYYMNVEFRLEVKK